MRSHATLMSRQRNDWETPGWLFNMLDCRYGFEVDAAANAANAKCLRWLGSGGAAEDALNVRWRDYGSRIWCNPPYSLARQFLAKGAESRLDGCLSVFLVAARTDTRAWQDYLWDAEGWDWRPGISGTFLRGRLWFEGATAGAPFPSAVIVMTPNAGSASDVVVP